VGVEPTVADANAMHTYESSKQAPLITKDLSVNSLAGGMRRERRENVESARTPRFLPDLSSRRRTGIEPARELIAPSSVLKTAGPTRNPDASASEDSGAGDVSV
jgi:hypothetical protein